MGRSLAQMLAAGERCDEAEALRIAGELLAVLKYLGGLLPPVVHRDIKPGNVVLAGGAWGGRVFLVDFGGVQGVSSGQGVGPAAAQRQGHRRPCCSALGIGEQTPTPLSFFP